MMDKADEQKRIDRLYADNKAALEAAQESANKGDWQYFEKVPMTKAEQPTITQAQYESAVKGRQDFRNAYRNLLPVLRAAEGIVAIWRAKGRKVDVTEYWDAINALDVAVTGGGARPDPEHLTRTTSLAAQDGLVEALDDATIDEIILNFAGGVVQVPSEHNPRGYVSYYRPREAMRKALSAIKEQHHD